MRTEEQKKARRDRERGKKRIRKYYKKDTGDPASRLATRAATLDRRDDAMDEKWNPLSLLEGAEMKRAEAEASRMEILRLNQEYAEHRKLYRH